MVTAGISSLSNLRERQIVEMKVHDIEFVRFLGHGFDEIQMMSERREQLAPSTEVPVRIPNADAPRFVSLHWRKGLSRVPALLVLP